jgi:hypothetical protein
LVEGIGEGVGEVGFEGDEELGGVEEGLGIAGFGLRNFGFRSW